MNDRIVVYREAIKIWCDCWPNLVIRLFALVMPRHYISQAERCLQNRKDMEQRRLKAIFNKKVI